ncbi:MAG: hypothetical protein QME60_06445 [Verrucomicrobiota bacterium]|nr:hypothetical protein [Verrucomicrobiota bacterium]
MSLQRRIRQVFESLFFCLGFLLVGFLPRPGILVLARRLGDAAYRLARKNRKLALANLDAAFGAERGAEDKARIARESFRIFSLDALDFFWFALFPARRLRRWVTFDDSANAIFGPAPMVGVTGHIGNWEVMGQAVALRGQRLLSVAAPLGNPLVNRMINWVRRRTGQEIADREGAMRRLLRHIRGGGMVALVIDQNVLPEEGGEFVEFFGLPVPISKAAAALMARGKAGILFCYCLADESGGYRVRCLPALAASEEARQPGAVTQHLADMIETAVRERPGQWLWMYRRWKFVPNGLPLERYPYYAKRVPARSQQ